VFQSAFSAAINLTNLDYHPDLYRRFNPLSARRSISQSVWLPVCRQRFKGAICWTPFRAGTWCSFLSFISGI